MSTADLKTFFTERKNDSAGLVLASVYETIGSTYSKTGARMLISGDGDFQGMLSGGCLEGDLAERSRQAVASGDTQIVTYDLRQDDEELWGLGVGCEGLMRIVLQPLNAASGFQPFTQILSVLEGDRVGIAATVIESEHKDLAPGSTVVGTELPFAEKGIDAGAALAIGETAADVLRNGQSSTREVDVDGRLVRVLFSVLRPPPNILVLGAGLDAQPVVRFCVELGWRVVLQDHRPAYIEKGDFAAAHDLVCVSADAIGDEIDLSRFDAAVVMSHHLLTDRKYLQTLAATDVPYIGLLGPVDRRKRLLAELGDSSTRLEGRLHGPAGLDIGGRGPTSIALSIVAQIHLLLMHDRVD